MFRKGATPHSQQVSKTFQWRRITKSPLHYVTSTISLIKFDFPTGIIVHHLPPQPAFLPSRLTPVGSSNKNLIPHTGTGCSGRGAEWVPPSEATSWTSSVTRTLPWTTSWPSTKRRLVMTGAPPTSPNIPISSIPWRLTTDRYRRTQNWPWFGF